MLNCKKVARLVASDELATAGFVMRARVRLHLMMCERCRRYGEQLRIIARVAREKLRALAHSSEAVARLEKSILDEAFGTSEEKQ